MAKEYIEREALIHILEAKAETGNGFVVEI